MLIFGWSVKDIQRFPEATTGSLLPFVESVVVVMKGAGAQIACSEESFLLDN